MQDVARLLGTELCNAYTYCMIETDTIKIKIICSNKSTNQIHHSLRFIARRSNTAQHVSGILLPIIRSPTTAVAASGLPIVIRDTVL